VDPASVQVAVEENALPIPPEEAAEKSVQGIEPPPGMQAIPEYDPSARVPVQTLFKVVVDPYSSVFIERNGNVPFDKSDQELNTKLPDTSMYWRSVAGSILQVVVFKPMILHLAEVELSEIQAR